MSFICNFTLQNILKSASLSAICLGVQTSHGCFVSVPLERFYPGGVTVSTDRSDCSYRSWRGEGILGIPGQGNGKRGDKSLKGGNPQHTHAFPAPCATLLTFIISFRVGSVRELQDSNLDRLTD